MNPLIKNLVVVCVSMLITGIAQADVILESATLGTTGLTGGVSINTQFIGARFQVTETTTVECIGGHMYGSGTNFFGAVAALSSGSDLPDGTVAGPDFLYINLFQPETPSTDLRVSANFVLPPGDYGLVFGSREFGASASGAMPTNGTDTPAASYFFWNGTNWNNSGFRNGRFTVANGADCDGAIESTEVRNDVAGAAALPVTPVPTFTHWGVILLILSIAAVIIVRRRYLI